MRRDDVLSRLKLVGFGLTSNADEDEGRFQFRGGKVSAHNGIYGMWSDLDIGAEAALPGGKLMEMLGSSSAEEVTFQRGNDIVSIVMGRTKLDMHIVAVSGKAVPDEDGVVLEWNPDWKEPLEMASWSMSDDPQRPELSGITMHATDGAMIFYSTIGLGISRCRVACDIDPGLIGSSVIVPTKYMQVIQKVVASLPCKAMQFDDDCLHTIFGNSIQSVHLYGDFISAAHVDRYETSIAGISNGFVWSPVPDGFAEVLGRVESAGGATAVTAITHDGRSMQFKTSADFGTLYDELPCDRVGVDCSVKASTLRRAASIATEVAFSPSCVGLRKGDNYLYLQSTVRDA